MRYAIGLEYDGSGFFGWQTQRQEPTVQSSVETALGRVANHEVSVFCCGRTDTGVHAVCQVAHFDTEAQRPLRSWVLGANSYLPAGISMLWIREVDAAFHARFSAFARTYRYRILNRWVRPALDARRSSWCYHELDQRLMQEAAVSLAGVHDFSAFRAVACQARHAVREIHAIEVKRIGDEVHIEVSANGFLYHMVRNIAGCLLLIGQRKRPVSWMREVLESRDRNLCGPTAPPEGLYFLGARYPAHYGLPTGSNEALVSSWDEV